MATDYSDTERTKLPQLSVVEFIVLITALEALADDYVTKNNTLPPNFIKARLRMGQARKSQNLPNEDPLTKKQADARIDDSWRAMEAFLRSFKLLREDGISPGKKEAEQIYAILIGSNLAFLNIPFELEWEESKKRLASLDEKNLGKVIELMGGQRHLAQLREAFEQYGVALRLTVPRPEELPALLPLLLAAQSAVRYYIDQARALFDPDLPKTQEDINHLLKPLEDASARVAAERAASARARQAELTTEEPPDA
jgi:hypothetical protein